MSTPGDPRALRIDIDALKDRITPRGPDVGPDAQRGYLGDALIDTVNALDDLTTRVDDLEARIIALENP